MLRPLALDIESARIAPGLQAPPLTCVALSARGWNRLLPWYDWEDQVTAILRDPTVLIVGHNIAFDMMDLAAECPALIPLIFEAYEQDRITCTQVRQKLLDIAGGIYRGFDDIDGQTQKLSYSLEDLALRHLGKKLDKDTWRLRYGEFRAANLPLEQWPEGARKYPLDDTDTTLEVFEIQESNAFYLADQFRQARAAFWLKLMTAWGIRTDAQGVFELAEKTQRSIDLISADLVAAGLLKPDRTVRRRSGIVETEKGSRNVKTAQARICEAYARLGKPPPMTDPSKMYPNGQPSTGKVSCEESGDPLLIKYAQLTSLSTVINKDIPLLELGINQPIHSYFEELLETGRTSSAKPNIQNLRRLPGIRECFVPNCLRCGVVHTSRDIDAGYCITCRSPLTVFIACDYGGLELCTLAQACKFLFKFSALGDALNANKDPHLIFASQIRKEPYDVLQAVRKGKLGGLQLDPSGKWYWTGSVWAPLPTEDDVDDARQTGKVANFGFPGGLGPASLVFFALNNYNVKMTEDEARAYKKVWLQTWPEIRDYFTWIGSHTDKPFPQIQQLFSNRFRGGVRYTEACNTIFQGLGADIAKAAGWRIARACYVDTESPLFGCRIVNFIHDEFLLLCPEPRAHEAAQELKRIMLDAARPWLPDINIKGEELVMRRYSNEAKQIWKDDRLIPWSPESVAA